MYQSLEPEPEGAIFPKRSVPQEDYSTPHDAGASMANWLETNIQGGALMNILIVTTSCSMLAPDHPTGLWLEEFAVPFAAFSQAGAVDSRGVAAGWRDTDRPQDGSDGEGPRQMA